MNKSNNKIAKLLVAFIVMVILAVLATVAWFYFTVRPDMNDTLFQTIEYGSLKVSATEYGEDIGLNGEIELDVDEDKGELYPGSSGSLTVWITNDSEDIKSFILTYVEAAPETDEEVFEKAKDICGRHILLFKNRTKTEIVDSDGNPVLDDDGNPTYDYTYAYSDLLLPVGEYTDEDPVPEYRIFGELVIGVPKKVTLYWVWPYDYEEYGEIGDYDYLFPQDPEATADPEESGILSDEERYDVEDSYIGKVVNKLRFKFFINANRSIEGLLD